VTLYLWSLKGASTLGWTVALIFAVCCALRLARFNTKLDEIDPMPWAGQFFTWGACAGWCWAGRAADSC
jgi:CDP-diacylglycerol--serine O-phosphatidyltransferase